MPSRRLEDVVAGALPRCGYRDLGSQIPAKDQLVAGHLVVDPGDRLMLVKVFGELILDLATGIRGLGQLRGEVHRRRAEEGRIDAVADEGGAQVDLPPGARRRRDRREVAREHLGRRHMRNVARRHLTPDGALVATEKEELVLDDGAAQRAAELVAPEAVILLLAVGAERGKMLRRVETTIAQELEEVSGERFVPDLVTALTDAPDLTPFSAERPLVATWNSWSASGNGSGRLALLCGLLCSASSSV